MLLKRECNKINVHPLIILSDLLRVTALSGAIKSCKGLVLANIYSAKIKSFQCPSHFRDIVKQRKIISTAV